jgi:glyoxylase-like metal-dependent hydrolase (beta-lactamase superfamily II)
MNIQKIVVGQIDVNCYVVSDDSKSEAMIIDPGDEFERIGDLIDSMDLIPKYIVFTHAHYDHVCAVKELKDKYNALIVMHEDEQTVYHKTKHLCISWGYEPEDFPPPDLLVRENDTIQLGRIAFKVIHTPGHTPGSMCLHCENILFTGDTLFQGSVGRTDLPGSNTKQLRSSLKKIASLPLDTKVNCGHGKETTIGEEIKHNPFLISS